MARLSGSRKGLTLIEVLVSMSIFLVVLLAIYQLFDTSQATYESGTRKQDVQQQARLAMDEMVRSLRMAGYVPENFDANVANDLTSTARLHLGTANAIAVFGSLDGTNQSAVFLFCQSGSTLVTKRSASTVDAATYAAVTGNSATYTCDNADLMADNVTRLQFTYFNTAGAQIAANLDGKNAGAVLSLAPRVDRDAVRTIVITLQITEQVPQQQAQVYTLTSTVRLRNLNNS
ncbi:MAG TPA: prepilin-type N-terminal cleavage/methylation domain-containing protein [Candidatus Methylomirabilis sp.]|nr:prepilin-type N-terminal cleavage/methylation domain-containing protein [Candidatus Methylomirabilis sp.]